MKMKWTEQQIAKLREFCKQGVSNKNIAYRLGMDIKEVYAKRSQLGITIDKCKGITLNPEFETAITKQKPKGMHKDVRDAFKALDGVVLLVIGSDRTSERDAKTYEKLAELLMIIESTFNELVEG